MVCSEPRVPVQTHTRPPSHPLITRVPLPALDLLKPALKRGKRGRSTDEHGTHDGCVKRHGHALHLPWLLLLWKHSTAMVLPSRPRYTYGVNNVKSPSFPCLLIEIQHRKVRKRPQYLSAMVYSITKLVRDNSSAC